MSEPEEKKPDAPPPKKGASPMIATLLTGLIAGGAAFGGAKLSAAHAAPGAPAAEHAAVAPPPPGPTVGLEPFVLLAPDATKKMHAMRVTISVEGEGGDAQELHAPDPRRRPHLPPRHDLRRRR